MNWLVGSLMVALCFVTGHFVEGWISGWPRLVRAYPAGGEAVVRTQSFVSGELGQLWQGVGVLTLSACDRGLKVSTWLRAPFVVPWRDIRTEPSSRHTQLIFGEPEVGRLRISAKTWKVLEANCPPIG